MLRMGLAFCGLAIVCPPLEVRAEPSPQGTYRRTGSYDQTAKIRALKAGNAFSGSFSVATRGCTGTVDADGKAESPTRIVFVKRDEMDGVCRITMEFTPDFQAVKVSNDGCLYWHGASCDFEGSLGRVGR